MMRAALLSVAGAAAVCAAAVPAVVGMMGNTSFSHHIPVRVPVGASAPHLATDDRGDGSPTGPPVTAGPTRTSHEPAEPSGEDSHRSERSSHTSESSEHGAPVTEDRRHPGGGGRNGGAVNRTSEDSGSGRGPGGGSGSGPVGGSGSRRHGDDHSGRG
jgi:hypothetical protein